MYHSDLIAPLTLPGITLENSRKAAIEKFQTLFCGLNTTSNSNEFVTEYKLPTACEMPLGMAVDGDKVSYVSTKNGSLGLYMMQNKIVLLGRFLCQFGNHA